MSENARVPFRFNTANIAPEQRADEWRAVSSDQFVPLDPTPIGEVQLFGARLVADHFADCGWALISTTRHTVHRTESTIAQASPGTLFVNLQLEGEGSLTQGDVTRGVRPGDVAIIDTDAPFALSYPGSTKLACFSVPKERLHEELSAQVLTDTRPDAASLATFLRGMALGGVQSTQHHRELVSQLISLLTQCTRVEFYSQSEQTITNLREVIEVHLENPRLSSSDLAALTYISRSRLYEVLATRNLTVRGLLNEARIDRAERLLLDPTYAQHSMSRISALVGFADVGTFTRVFKRRHHLTPGAWKSRSNSLDSVRGNPI